MLTSQIALVVSAQITFPQRQEVVQKRENRSWLSEQW